MKRHVDMVEDSHHKLLQQYDVAYDFGNYHTIAVAKTGVVIVCVLSTSLRHHLQMEESGLGLGIILLHRY